jgi:hypothetical protein
LSPLTVWNLSKLKPTRKIDALLTQAFKFYEERYTLSMGEKVRQNGGFSRNPRAVP